VETQWRRALELKRGDREEESGGGAGEEGGIERLISLARRSSKSEGESDIHPVLNKGDGFREGLNPTRASVSSTG